MRIIKVSLKENKIIIELNKRIIELNNLNDLKYLGLSKNTLNKLEKAILTARKKMLNDFTVKY